MRGVPAASLIGAGRRSPHAVIAELGEWLARWNQTTLVPGRLESSWAERELLAPAALVADDLPDGPAYLAWLQRRAAAAHGEALPSVAVHRDLTMSNVLLADDALGIVDWEVAGAAGLPLRDFLYAAVDASSARDGYRDRVAAFDRCFPPAGPPRQLAERLDRLRRQAGLTEATASLCVHACWLQHALDERAKRTGGEPRPFLAIVRRLAERAAGGGYPW
jgi:aminoglycoside phosphotransferase (APT) family kinase protein